MQAGGRRFDPVILHQDPGHWVVITKDSHAARSEHKPKALSFRFVFVEKAVFFNNSKSRISVVDGKLVRGKGLVSTVPSATYDCVTRLQLEYEL